MSLNQRISPNLSQSPCLQQASVCKQQGFTLIELMAVVAIISILAAIGSGDWLAMKHRTEVQSAVSKIKSAFGSARMKALATGRTQYVGIDFKKIKVVSTIHDNSDGQAAFYDPVAKAWLGEAVWETLDGVKLKDSMATGAIPAAPNTAIKTFYFNSKGSVDVDGSATLPRSVRVYSANDSTDLVNILVVSNVTGRSYMKKCTVAEADAAGC